MYSQDERESEETGNRQVSGSLGVRRRKWS